MGRLERFVAALPLLIASHAGSAIELVDQEPFPSWNRVARSGDGRYLALAGGRRVQIVDWQTQRVAASLDHIEDEPSVIAMNGDGTRLAVGHFESVAEYDTTTMQEIVRHPDTCEVDALAYTKHGVLFGIGRGCASRWTPNNAEGLTSRGAALGLGGARIVADDANDRFVAAVAEPGDRPMRYRLILVSLGANGISAEPAGPSLTRLDEPELTLSRDGTRLAILSGPVVGRRGFERQLSLYLKTARGFVQRSSQRRNSDDVVHDWNGDLLLVGTGDALQALDVDARMRRTIPARMERGYVYRDSLWSLDAVDARGQEGVGHLVLGVTSTNAVVVDRPRAFKKHLNESGCFDGVRDRLVSMTDDEYIKIVDVASLAIVDRFPRKRAALQCLVSDDGRWLATWDRDSVAIYDIATGRLLNDLPQVDGRVVHGGGREVWAEIEGNGRFAFDTRDAAHPALVVGNATGQVTSWRFLDGSWFDRAVRRTGSRAVAFVLHPVANKLWIGDEAGDVEVFDSTNGAHLRRLALDGGVPPGQASGYVMHLAFARDGRRVVVARLREASIRDADSGRIVQSIGSETSREHVGLRYFDYGSAMSWMNEDRTLLMHGATGFHVVDVATNTVKSDRSPTLVPLVFGGSAHRDLVVVAAEQGVRLWNSRTGRWFGIVSAGDDAESVFAATESGYFVGFGPEVLRFGLRHGRRTVNTYEVFERFHDPAHVRDVFAHGVDGSDDEAARLNLADALASPPPHMVVAERRGTEDVLRLDVSIHDTGGGIGAIRLYRNGRLLRQWNDDDIDDLRRPPSRIVRSVRLVAQPSVVNLTLELGVLPGENLFGFVAFDRRHLVQSAPTTVARQRPAQVTPAPRSVLLSIGVDEPGGGLPKLNFAESDAVAFAEAYVASAADSGVGNPATQRTAETIVLRGPEATRDAILGRLARLANEFGPDDRLAIYFAGHGSFPVDGYQLLVGGGAQAPSFLTFDDLANALKDVAAGSVTVFLDTCHAGAANESLARFYDARTSSLAHKNGLRLLAAAGSQRSALDGVDGHGPFTGQLISLFTSSAADRNRDGTISYAEAGRWLTETLPQITAASGRPQTPVLMLGKVSEVFRRTGADP